MPTSTLATLLCGALSLLIWLLAANEERTRVGNLLALSGWYFLAPMLIVVAIDHSLPLLTWVIPGLLMVMLEEALKLAAAREVAPERRSIFYLVALFGILELSLAKAAATLSPFWRDGELAMTLWLMCLPVVMHAATAAIYAYWPRADGRFRYWTCVGLHAAFNLSREVYRHLGEAPLPLVLADSLLWIVLLWLLLRRRRPEALDEVRPAQAE